MVKKSPTHSRRSVIAAGICSVASAGCSRLEANPSMLDIVFINNTDRRFVITVHLSASEEGNPNDMGERFSEPITVEPQEEVRRKDIAESQQYLIEYDVDKIVDGDPLQTDHGHAHFYPTEGGENPQVAFDIVDSGKVNKRVS